MLNRENIERLIHHLESGSYTKTTGALKDDVGFCCLGVACDLSGAGQWRSDMYVYDDGTADEGGWILSDRPVARDYGFNDEQIMRLMNLNDGNDDWGPVVEYLKELLDAA